MIFHNVFGDLAEEEPIMNTGDDFEKADGWKEELEAFSERRWRQDMAIAIDENDQEKVSLLLNIGESFSSDEYEIYVMIQMFNERINDLLDEEILERWNDYISPEVKGGKFARVQVQKKYQAKGQRAGLVKEERDYNASKRRIIKQISAKLDNLEMLDDDIIETEPVALIGRSWSFGSDNSKTTIVRTKVTPYSRFAEVELPEHPVRAKSSCVDNKKYDRRLRNCAPCTSKSSPFSQLRR